MIVGVYQVAMRTLSETYAGPTINKLPLLYHTDEF